jgi:hypothetical protein
VDGANHGFTCALERTPISAPPKDNPSGYAGHERAEAFGTECRARISREGNQLFHDGAIVAWARSVHN